MNGVEHLAVQKSLTDRLEGLDKEGLHHAVLLQVSSEECVAYATLGGTTSTSVLKVAEVSTLVAPEGVTVYQNRA